MATSISFGFKYTVTGSGNSWTPQSAGVSGSYNITDTNPVDDPLTTEVVEVPDGITAINDTTGFTVTGLSSPTLLGYDTANNGDVLVSDGATTYLFSNTGTYYTEDGQGANTSITQTIDNTTGDYTYCFLAGTRINTSTGLIPVEQLITGDEVLTADGKTAKVRFNFKQIKTSHAFAGTKHYPIKISAGALADNTPSSDLYVTPDHAIYFPALNIFAEASTLINGVSIYQLTEMPASFTYYHLLCENQEIVLAENTPAETFIDNVTMAQFDNYAEYVALYSNHNEMIELDIPRAKSSRQLPKELKEDLLQRAELLYPSVKSKAA